MPSPFPGMNPWLEQDDAWHDFHESFVPMAAERMGAQLETSYIVKIDERVYIHELPANERLHSAVDDEGLAFIEIRDRKSRQLITVVELLSPINKRLGPDRDMYLAKRRTLIHTGVNLVEIDLLRGGERTQEGIPGCDYCIVVSRSVDWPRVGIWPLQLTDRLPIIPIPLRPPDPDARLDVQEILHAIYDAARYVHYIYDGEPEPPLSPEQTGWTRAMRNG